MYAHRGVMANSAADFRLIENAESNGHMTIICKNENEKTDR